MYDTVILPLDGSLHAEFALPLAVDEARRHHATLVLLYVLPHPDSQEGPVDRGGPSVRPADGSGRELDEAMEEGRRYLAQVKERCRLVPEPEAKVVVGEPVERILAECGRRRRPLIVMTTGDVPQTPSSPLSEVARRVLIAGTVPVLGVHRPPLVP